MDIVEEILAALESEDPVMLATIISTSGSTPASAFSKMLVKNKGKSWVGTVGGGCMEGDVLEAARKLYAEVSTQVLTFNLNETDMVQGLICGGSLNILIEPVTREHIPLLRELKMLRDEGEDCMVATLCEGGRSVFKRLLKSPSDKNRLTAQWNEIERGDRFGIARLVDETEKAHHRNETRRLRAERTELILEPIQGRPNLIIFGGGHVSRYISRAAAMTGFRVTVVDDRKEYANAGRFPEADDTLAVEFYDAFNHLTVKPSTYIIIVTRGHRSDEEVLEQAIKTPAKYIGMIGSRRKVLTTYGHLVSKGVLAGSLKKVHAPMGLEIGAVTAEEIGISVVAQLIYFRRGGTEPLQHKSKVMEEIVETLHPK